MKLPVPVNFPLLVTAKSFFSGPTHHPDDLLPEGGATDRKSSTKTLATHRQLSLEPADGARQSPRLQTLARQAGASGATGQTAGGSRSQPTRHPLTDPGQPGYP
ncbi:MAG: hypothetical protein V3T54_00420, partial [Acidobacteriota bacterium]